MSEGIEFRVERPEDRAAALEVERRSFEPHGSADEEIAIVMAVRDDEGSFALVAVDGGHLVGHVQFSRGWIGDTSVVALGPIGVLPKRQRSGIGFGPALPLGIRDPFAGVDAADFVTAQEDFQLASLDGEVALEGEVRWHPALRLKRPRGDP